MHLRPVQRHGMTMLPLTRRAGGIQAYKMIIPASSRRRKPDLQRHEGYASRASEHTSALDP